MVPFQSCCRTHSLADRSKSGHAFRNSHGRALIAEFVHNACVKMKNCPWTYCLESYIDGCSSYVAVGQLTLRSIWRIAGVTIKRDRVVFKLSLHGMDGVFSVIYSIISEIPA